MREGTGRPSLRSRGNRSGGAGRGRLLTPANAPDPSGPISPQMLTAGRGEQVRDPHHPRPPPPPRCTVSPALLRHPLP